MSFAWQLFTTKDELWDVTKVGNGSRGLVACFQTGGLVPLPDNEHINLYGRTLVNGILIVWFSCSFAGRAEMDPFQKQQRNHEDLLVAKGRGEASQAPPPPPQAPQAPHTQAHGF